jgi:uncharacterized membrane protein YtjA (UPF0391 family)
MKSECLLHFSCFIVKTPISCEINYTRSSTACGITQQPAVKRKALIDFERTAESRTFMHLSQRTPNLNQQFDRHFAALLKLIMMACDWSYTQRQPNCKIMLRWTITFLIIALVAAIFGFTGIAAGAASIAKIIFYIFLVFFVISLIAGAFNRAD